MRMEQEMEGLGLEGLIVRGASRYASTPSKNKDNRCEKYRPFSSAISIIFSR